MEDCSRVQGGFLTESWHQSEWIDHMNILHYHCCVETGIIFHHRYLKGRLQVCTYVDDGGQIQI